MYETLSLRRLPCQSRIRFEFHNGEPHEQLRFESRQTALVTSPLKSLCILVFRTFGFFYSVFLRFKLRQSLSINEATNTSRLYSSLPIAWDFTHNEELNISQNMAVLHCATIRFAFFAKHKKAWKQYSSTLIRFKSLRVETISPSLIFDLASMNTSQYRTRLCGSVLF